ncbi:MAG: pentapeptide repeat-containing protein [Rhizobiaceae bacterium]
MKVSYIRSWSFMSLFAFLAASIFLPGSLRAETVVCEPAIHKELQPSELASVLNAHKEWVKNIGWSDKNIPGRAILCGVDLARANLTGSVLRGADLRGARLAYANLSNTDLRHVDFRNASLIEANLDGANADFADFRGAYLMWAKITNGSLRRSNLSGANISGTDLSDTSMVAADISHSVFSPTSPPKEGHVDGLIGLATVQVPFDKSSGQPRVAGLSLFRTSLKKMGLQSLERQATYAIERSRTSHALERWSINPIGAAEAFFRLLVFEMPVAYGLYPSRALMTILVLILVFAVIYDVCLRRSHSSQIVRVWPSGRVENMAGVLVWEKDAKIEVVERGSAIFGVSGITILFSVASAFNIGWKDLNVGSWIQRIQTHESTLHGVGWMRMIAGIQSLISVYLLAIWALTYFGRPFG